MTKWHRFPEEMPPLIDKDYLVTYKETYGDPSVWVALFTIDAYARKKKTAYQFLLGEFEDDITSSVTAWAEMPEPYIGKDDDDDEEAHRPHEP